jgi:hypothetical protein
MVVNSMFNESPRSADLQAGTMFNESRQKRAFRTAGLEAGATE